MLFSGGTILGKLLLKVPQRTNDLEELQDFACGCEDLLAEYGARYSDVKRIVRHNVHHALQDMHHEDRLDLLNHLVIVEDGRKDYLCFVTRGNPEVWGMTSQNKMKEPLALFYIEDSMGKENSFDLFDVIDVSLVTEFKKKKFRVFV